MKNNVLKPFILSLIFTILCFQFTACGNQSDDYNADETTNNHTESSTNHITEDGTDNTGIDNNDGSDMNHNITGPEAGTENNLGQDIENAGDAILDGAEDLLEGDNPENSTDEHRKTQNNNQ